jgi:hypothetical protein
MTCGRYWNFVGRLCHRTARVSRMCLTVWRKLRVIGRCLLFRQWQPHQRVIRLYGQLLTSPVNEARAWMRGKYLPPFGHRISYHQRVARTTMASILLLMSFYSMDFRSTRSSGRMVRVDTIIVCFLLTSASSGDRLWGHNVWGCRHSH